MRTGTHVVAACCLVLVGACKDEPPSPPVVREPEVGAFVVHEWGLFGVNAGTPGRASAATEAAGSFHTQHRNEGGIGLGGLGTLGGKPVIYLHLDEGTDRATLDVNLGIPLANVVERFPTGASLDPATHRTSAGWHGVTVQRGRCAHPTPVPTAESLECKGTRDGFCEAAELRRYAGDGASCLTVGDTTSEVLFYRADALPTAPLPLRLEHEGEGWKLSGEPVPGPIFYVEVERLGAPIRIRRIEPADIGRPLGATPEGTLTPGDIRAAFLAEATRRGLGPGEAEAFVDAWAPAYFDACRRTGPEASGTPPPALAQVGRSLLYFAPESVVDAMVPLTTVPRARETKRVFLVRWVDESTVLANDPMSALGALLGEPIGANANGDLGAHGYGIGALGGVTCEGGCPVVELGTARVSAGLEEPQVRRVLRRNIGQLRHCYEQAIAQDTDLRGRLELMYVVGRDGSVVTSSVGHSTLRNQVLERCVAGAARRMYYPTPDPVGVVTVRLPLSFSRRAR